jgi:hypothetical protein
LAGCLPMKKARRERSGAGCGADGAHRHQVRVRLCAIRDSATLSARSMLPASEPSV